MFKAKILLGALGCLLALSSMAFSEDVNEDRITSAVIEAGKCLQKQQFAKVIELLEKELPPALKGNESRDFIGVYGIGYNNLGHSYLQLGQYEKAIEALTKARDVMGKWSAPYYLLGQAYARLNRPSESIANFQKGIELDPNAADYVDLICLISNYLEQGNKTKAEKILALGKKRFPKQMQNFSIAQFEELRAQSSEVNKYMNQAEVCYQNNDFKGAIENYRKVIEIDPSQEIAQYNLGKSLLMDGDTEKGIAECEKALTLGLDNVNLYRTLGKAYLEKEDWTKALKMYEKVKCLDPKDDSAYFVCGMLYMRLKNGWEAREEFKRAIEINPNNAEAHYELGWLYADYDPEYAKKELRRALELNPNHEGAKKKLKKIEARK